MTTLTRNRSNATTPQRQVIRRDDPRVAAAVMLRDREVADLIGVHVRTVHAWVAAGAMPAPVRLGPAGRCVRWRLREIEDWLAGREGTAT